MISIEIYTNQESQQDDFTAALNCSFAMEKS